MLHSPNDTIVAMATPPGKGGVSIIRISGKRATELLFAIAKDLTPHPRSHHLYLTSLYHPNSDSPIDQALAVLMAAPHSFTGDDCVEFHCHGGPYIVERLLDAAILLGARIADPGEFTERAFLNGKTDLTQAEAVADIINADCAVAHKLAVEHLQGALGEQFRDYRQKLSDVMVLLESAIDFSHEEDVYELETDAILERLTYVALALRRLRDNFDAGRRRRNGLKVVLLGATNAGKSSLFNALLGMERAIVTDVPGTTRDFLEEVVTVGGCALRIVDTAGLRETEDMVEAIGVGKSRAQKSAADIVIWVIDRAVELDHAIINEIEEQLNDGSQEMIVVINKSDLAEDQSVEKLRTLASMKPIVTLSLKREEGLEALQSAIAAAARRLTSSEGVLISRARHLEAVVRGLDAVERAEVATKEGLDAELIALDVREALDAVGSVVGEVTTDDILHRIFAEFCVGK